MAEQHLRLQPAVLGQSHLSDLILGHPDHLRLRLGDVGLPSAYEHLCGCGLVHDEGAAAPTPFRGWVRRLRPGMRRGRDCPKAWWSGVL
jgi:hypothetical protein